MELAHLTAFLLHEQQRQLAHQPDNSNRRLSTSSVYLEIAALRAFYSFAESEKLLARNVAENLSLPRRWKRLPKALTDGEIDQLLAAPVSERPSDLCDQAILELAYASGLRLAELCGVRLEQLHLEAGFLTIIGKGNKERVVPVGKKAVAALQRYIERGTTETGPPTIDGQRVPHTPWHAFRASDDVAADQETCAPRRHRTQRDTAHVKA